MNRASRLGAAAVLAGALSLALSGVVAADTIVGTIGHYDMTDGTTPSTAGAACLYATPGGGIYNIYRIVARKPSVWWPNTNASISGQHGQVGWQLIVRYKRPLSSTWTLLKKSDIQKAIAYEDAPAYDLNDRAPFTNLWVNINYANFSEANTQFKASVKVLWYKADGTVRGSVTHAVQYYVVKGDGFNSYVFGSSYCWRSFAVF